MYREFSANWLHKISAMLRLLLIHVVKVLLVAQVMLLFDGVAGVTSVEKFGSTNCTAFLQSATQDDQRNFEAILPTAEFWNFFTSRKSTAGDIMLVDVDMHSWEMLLNNVAALRASGSKLAENVYAIAYDNSTCSHLTSKGVPCYYSLSWNSQLIDMYKGQTGREPFNLHIVMMGRMMTTAVALCEGHNVFLSDTDVVFYRDPINYAFHNANIMITATPIDKKLTSWGGRFFVDKPGKFYTLNNGVVFYRSNPLTNAFALSLAIDSINVLKNSNDFEQGFLQKIFNKGMVNHRLKLHPCSKISDATTFRLNSALFLNTVSNAVMNSVGECYDCYHGQVAWSSKSLRKASGKRGKKFGVLKIGVYPLQRYLSYCTAQNGTGRIYVLDLALVCIDVDQVLTQFYFHCFCFAEFKDSLIASATAVRQKDSSQWDYGSMENKKSRPLFVHANCMGDLANVEQRFQKKIGFFHGVNSWFI